MKVIKNQFVKNWKKSLEINWIPSSPSVFLHLTLRLPSAPSPDSRNFIVQIQAQKLKMFGLLIGWNLEVEIVLLSRVAHTREKYFLRWLLFILGEKNFIFLAAVTTPFSLQISSLYLRKIVCKVGAKSVKSNSCLKGAAVLMKRTLISRICEFLTAGLFPYKPQTLFSVWKGGFYNCWIHFWWLPPSLCHSTAY